MRRIKDRSAPMTDNAEAAALITTAQAKCEGCRISWRMDKRRGKGRVRAFWHGEPANMTCTAQNERQALRDIAMRNGIEQVRK